MKIFPRNVMFELSNYCNLDCLHCYLSKIEPLHHMPLAIAKKLIDSAYNLHALKLTITGGEPTLHPQFKEILSYANRFDFCINLLSNMCIYNKEIINIISEMCDQVGVSLYSDTALLHDSIVKQSGAFALSTMNIKRLIKLNKNVSVNVTVMKSNVHNWKKIKKFIVEELGAKYSFNFRIFNRIDEYADFSPYRIDKFEAVNFIQEFAIEENIKIESMGYICSAGTTDIFIKSDGNVYPCVFFNAKIGNINFCDLSELWEGNNLLKQIRMLKNKDFASCSVCKKKYLCTPCMGENYNNGEIIKPNGQNCFMGEVFYLASKRIDSNA